MLLEEKRDEAPFCNGFRTKSLGNGGAAIIRGRGLFASKGVTDPHRSHNKERGSTIKCSLQDLLCRVLRQNKKPLPGIYRFHARSMEPKVFVNDHGTSIILQTSNGVSSQFDAGRSRHHT